MRVPTRSETDEVEKAASSYRKTWERISPPHPQPNSVSPFPVKGGTPQGKALGALFSMPFIKPQWWRDGSRPRDFSHGMSSNIKALGTVYHERCPMRFSSYVYRQRSREMLPQFSQSLLYHRCRRNWPAGTAPGPGTSYIVCH